MTDLLTSAQMRAIEEAAIGAGEVTGLRLMERAGRAAVAAILADWPANRARSAIVLCGPGNNGGDGYVIARRLADLGWRVDILALGDPARLTGDAAQMRALWAGSIGALDAAGPGEPAALVVDALFGTGLSRPVASDILAAREAALWRGAERARLVAVDILSGLDADSGRVLGAPGGTITPADLTVTFHAAKLGHALADGPRLGGRLQIAPIGLEGRSRDAATVIEGPLMPLAKDEGRHKYDNGHALVLSGPATRTGAARLAARAALRVGAGLVTILAPPEALAEHAARLDAIMLGEAGTPGALARWLEDPRLNALCIGPGLGPDRAPDLVATAAEAAHGPALVLDADALSGFADAPDHLFAICNRATQVVLTPHMGEFGRLFPDLSDALKETPVKGPAYSKVDAARDAARRAGAVICLKGPDTIIADPAGRVAVLSPAFGGGAPWLATAGTGDVLAGLVTGLMARGGGAFEAAATAAWLHRRAAQSFGPGLIAEDLPDRMPEILRPLC